MNKMEQHLSEQQEHLDAPETIVEDSPRISTRATQLAMELSKEKKRLTEELSTLQAEYENLAPTTPVGTVDWYIKWVAVVAAVAGIFITSAGLFVVGQILYLIGSISWTVVGIYWNDKAIILGSIIPATAVALNLVRTLFA